MLSHSLPYLTHYAPLWITVFIITPVYKRRNGSSKRLKGLAKVWKMEELDYKLSGKFEDWIQN